MEKMPPPYNPRKNVSTDVVMGKAKFITLMVVSMVMGAMTAVGVGFAYIERYYDSFINNLVSRQMHRYNEQALKQVEGDMTDEIPDDTEDLIDYKDHYVAEDEISFVMNAVTGFIRVPAEMIWVKTLDFKSFNVPVEDGRITVTSGEYRWDIDVESLRADCGSGARKLPLKVMISSRRSKKEKVYHVVSLTVQFRNNGTADVNASGYIFDK